MSALGLDSWSQSNGVDTRQRYPNHGTGFTTSGPVARPASSFQEAADAGKSLRSLRSGC